MRLLSDIGQRRKKTSSPVYGLILKKKKKKKTEDRNGIRSALAQQALLVDFFLTLREISRFVVF